MSQRIVSLDLIKGIAILLVIIAHCIQFGSGQEYLRNELFFDNSIFKFIYSYHMPLFMIVSGYLSYFTLFRNPFLIVLKSRFTKLLIPILIWQTIWLLCFEDSLFTDSNKSIWLSYINTQWFITSVFINSLFVLLCKKLFNDSLYVYIGVIIVSLFIPNYHSESLYVFMFPYFLLGYLYNKHITIFNRQKYTFPTFICITIAFCLMLPFYDKCDYVYTSGTFIIRNHHFYFHQLIIDIYRWVIGVVGSLEILFIFNYISQRWSNCILVKGICHIGTKTMGIYIVSTYIFKKFHLLPINQQECIYIIIEVIIVTFLSYFVVLLLEHNKHTRKSLLGGR